MIRWVDAGVLVALAGLAGHGTLALTATPGMELAAEQHSPLRDLDRTLARVQANAAEIRALLQDPGTTALSADPSASPD